MWLYKGRYLLAKYDLKDRLIAVGTTPKELGFKKYAQITNELKNKEKFGRHKTYNLFLIDCLEKHDDIFAEEDEIFLESMNVNNRRRKQTIMDYANDHKLTINETEKKLKNKELYYERGDIYEKEL